MPFRQSAAHIDLHGRQDQMRQVQRRVAMRAHLDELILADAVMHMDIALALGADRRL